MHNLSATAIKSAKPKDTPTKLPDGGGLYLLTRPRGGKYWRYDYRFAGKRKTLALGIYPDVSLAQARKAHLVAREGLSEGIDPAEVKKINNNIYKYSLKKPATCIKFSNGKDLFKKKCLN